MALGHICRLGTEGVLSVLTPFLALELWLVFVVGTENFACSAFLEHVTQFVLSLCVCLSLLWAQALSV